MSVSSQIAIYFIVWWVVLFAVLPFGVRSQHEEGGAVEGTDPGAPVAHNMLRKIVWTTLISAVLYAAGFAANRAGLLTVETLSRLMGLPL